MEASPEKRRLNTRLYHGKLPENFLFGKFGLFSPSVQTFAEKRREKKKEKGIETKKASKYRVREL
jgi:hypothetical protein